MPACGSACLPPFAGLLDNSLHRLTSYMWQLIQCERMLQNCCLLLTSEKCVLCQNATSMSVESISIIFLDMHARSEQASIQLEQIARQSIWIQALWSLTRRCHKHRERLESGRPRKATGWARPSKFTCKHQHESLTVFAIQTLQDSIYGITLYQEICCLMLPSMDLAKVWWLKSCKI